MEHLPGIGWNKGAHGYAKEGEGLLRRDVGY